MDINSLEIGFLDNRNHPDFNGIYDCYSKVFTLPTERESKENFLDILDRNEDPEVKGSKAKEMWVYLKDPKGEVVGASNFDVFAGSKTPGYHGTIQAVYDFVAPEYRGKGFYKKLIEAREKVAADYCRKLDPSLPAELNIPTLLEQNSPMLMTANEYLGDNEAAGIDQCERRTLFESLGFRTAKFRYIQPDLEEVGGEGKCTYLDTQVKAKGNSIPASVVKEHLERFFKLSFLEGTDINNPGLEDMARSIPEKGDIQLLPKGVFKFLSQLVSEKWLKTLPEDQRDTPLHQVVERQFPMLAHAIRSMPGVEGPNEQVAMAR